MGGYSIKRGVEGGLPLNFLFFVCMYAYIYMYVCVCVCVCLCVYIYIHIYTYICPFQLPDSPPRYGTTGQVFAYMYVCMYVCINTHTHMCVCVCVPGMRVGISHTCVYTRYASVYITHTHIHTHTDWGEPSSDPAVVETGNCHQRRYHCQPQVYQVMSGREGEAKEKG